MCMGSILASTDGSVAASALEESVTGASLQRVGENGTDKVTMRCWLER
jgi:hypothetical protein